MCRSGGQDPSSAVVGAAAGDQVAQVEPSGAALEPGVVVDGAAVAQLDSPPAVAGDLGDGPFDVRPLLAVLLAQLRVRGPLGPGARDVHHFYWLQFSVSEPAQNRSSQVEQTVRSSRLSKLGLEGVGFDVDAAVVEGSGSAVVRVDDHRGEQEPEYGVEPLDIPAGG